VRIARWTAAVAALALAACAKTETPEQAQARMQTEADSLRPIVEAAGANASRWIAAKQSDSIAQLYATDAAIMPPNMPAVAGRAGVKALFDTAFAAGAMTLTFTVGSVTANGPMAVEHGTFRTSFTPTGASAPAMSGTGKYLTLWKKTDGQWLIAADIWNDDAPPAPPPAPTRRR
jgi:ketosteroid isomerase-like protein